LAQGPRPTIQVGKGVSASFLLQNSRPNSSRAPGTTAFAMGDLNAPLRVRTREGCRGGREQFQWNQIKDQEFKDREQYLGSSTKVGLMGKFGRYYVHDWYARKRESTEKIADERASVQAYEEELMQEALGLKPKKLLLAKKQLTDEELQEFLKRDDDRREDQKGRSQMGPQAKVVTNEYGEQVATSNEEYVAVAAREAPVKGLGFAMHRTAKLEAIKAEAFGTESELSGTKSASSSVKVEPKDEVKEEEGGSSGSGLRREIKEELLEAKSECADKPASKRRRGEQEDMKPKKEKKDKKEKKEKKREKKLRKIEKKLKKAEKKERKAAQKLAQTARSSSSSSS